MAPSAPSLAEAMPATQDCLASLPEAPPAGALKRLRKNSHQQPPEPAAPCPAAAAGRAPELVARTTTSAAPAVAQRGASRFIAREAGEATEEEAEHNAQPRRRRIGGGAEAREVRELEEEELGRHGGFIDDASADASLDEAPGAMRAIYLQSLEGGKPGAAAAAEMRAAREHTSLMRGLGPRTVRPVVDTPPHERRRKRRTEAASEYDASDDELDRSLEGFVVADDTYTSTNEGTSTDEQRGSGGGHRASEEAATPCEPRKVRTIPATRSSDENSGGAAVEPASMSASADAAEQEVALQQQEAAAVQAAIDASLCEYEEREREQRVEETPPPPAPPPPPPPPPPPVMPPPPPRPAAQEVARAPPPAQAAEKRKRLSLSTSRNKKR